MKRNVSIPRRKHCFLFYLTDIPEKNMIFYSCGVFGLINTNCIIFYSILFYSILFYSILFYSILFYSILFYSIFLCFIVMNVPVC